MVDQVTKTINKIKNVFKAICMSGKGFNDTTYNKTAKTADEKIKITSLIRIRKKRILDTINLLIFKVQKSKITKNKEY